MVFRDTAEIDEARRLISDVMNGREFDPDAVTDVSYLESVLKKIWEWAQKVLEKFLEFLNRLFGTAKALFGGGSLSGAEAAARWAAVILGAAALAAVVFAVVRSLTRRARRKKDPVGAELADFTADPDAAFRLYLEQLSRSDPAAALRYLFIALLARLNKAGALRADPAKTNRRYLREIGDSVMVARERVLPFFRLFDVCRYGGRPVPEDSLRALADSYLSIDADLTAAAAAREEAPR